MQHAQRGFLLPAERRELGAARARVRGGVLRSCVVLLRVGFRSSRGAPTARSTAPSERAAHHQLVARRRSRAASQRSGPCRFDALADDRVRSAGTGRGYERRAQVERAGRGQQFDGEHARRARRRCDAACARRSSPSRRGPPASPRTESSPRSPGPRAASSRSRSPPACTARSCDPSPPRGRRRGTAAGRCCGWRRACGRCDARRSTRGRPPRSRGSRARRRPVRRGSCRWSRCGRPAARPGCRWSRRAPVPATVSACASVSRTAPATCGAQRSEYASCTPHVVDRCDATIAAALEQPRHVARAGRLPGMRPQRLQLGREDRGRCRAAPRRSSPPRCRRP